MGPGDSVPPSPRRGGDAAVSNRAAPAEEANAPWVIETVVSPFHCLYQDALEFHTQSLLRLPRSEAEASRLARAALLLYLEAAGALVHQAAAELGRPEVAGLLTDPDHPRPLAEAWRLLPLIVGECAPGGYEPESPPWPQFAELLSLRNLWAYPGPPATRRAYYRSPQRDAEYEPLVPHQVPAGLAISADRLQFPRTGLPRDPYALRPRHLDIARGTLDAAIAALDRRLGGALTRDGRHRKEPVRVVYPPRPQGS